MKIWHLFIIVIILGILVDKGYVKNENRHGQGHVGYEIYTSTEVAR